MDDYWVEAELYSETVVTQIINEQYYNRKIKCYQVSLQALLDLWCDDFFTENLDFYNNLKDSVQNLSNTCKPQIDVFVNHKIIWKEWFK